MPRSDPAGIAGHGGHYNPPASGAGVWGRDWQGKHIRALSRQYDGGGDIYGVIAADMDGDAALDLLVGHTGSGMVSLLPNNGEGAFELTKDYYFEGAWDSSFDVADVDMDGHLELVGANGGTVYVFPLEVVD